MKIVILDGYTLNPGDLSWEPLKELGEVTVYERTAPKEARVRLMQLAVNNLKAFLEGKPVNVVNN